MPDQSPRTLEEQQRRQAALLALTGMIAEADAEAAICQAVARGLYDGRLGFDFVAVLLVDETTGERELIASRGWKDAPAGLRVRPGQGLSERRSVSPSSRSMTTTADIIHLVP